MPVLSGEGGFDGRSYDPVCILVDTTQIDFQNTARRDRQREGHENLRTDGTALPGSGKIRKVCGSCLQARQKGFVFIRGFNP